ncbi:MAG: GDSL-type esterase/lipase family protein [Bacteroidetes bacterium]|nr:GDSL-type esterase/lipase family protein [Rhodothermia bacterium]MCS7154507.1 GDSL-type esterase/lipase family protein [Bacteroidota bacterium]MCX7906880.1 GDSL-type esterase/lipase family protein [Bacteroidota bacterium]MDW8136841.1 GDSL-type esterase/lipase family protein [Bacteroidota bacterium]MDW8285289.1 GDSL-type esterase/lipase family protein [Bacteroidota bacterium]
MRPEAFSRPIVLVGDEWIAGLDVVRYLPAWPVLNKGLPGADLGALSARLFQDALRLFPDLVVLCAGAHDLRKGRTEEAITGDLEAIIGRLLGASRPIRTWLCAVPPLPASWSPPERVRALNRRLQGLAEAYGLVFLDLHKLWADPKGALREAYRGDPISPAAYRVWGELLEAHLRAL